ncbi:MAG TPA: MarR family transcriptional regulator [Actinomycetota bacterium]|nr:MarR family transcriptional regulator [Actinomycetota bacterium]
MSDDDLAQDLRLSVTRLARRLRREADTGASPSMLAALATIERHEPLTLTELAAHEHIQPPSATAVAARLEEARLVQREVDEADRRSSRLRVTAEGRRFLDRSRSRKTAFLASRLRRLSDGERTTLRKAVALLERLLEEQS